MKQYEAKWFRGTTQRGIPKVLADEIWHKLLEFGHYGFNKSHSACYGLQAYQDMYLKVKHPAEFYAAFLTYEDDDEKRKTAIREAKIRGIEIVMPDVNLSDSGFTVDEDGRLVLGLLAIKGVGKQAAQKIIKLRPFHAIEDVMAAAIPHKPLIEAGACDSLADRSYLLSEVLKVGSKKVVYWQVWEHLKHNAKLKTPREIPSVNREPSSLSLVQVQAALLNLPVSSLNMTEEQQDLIKKNIYTPEEIDQAPKGTVVIVGGEITKVTRKKTKRDKPFANVTIVFGADQWNLKFWEMELLRFEDLLVDGQIIMASGKKDEWNGYVSVVVKDLVDIETLAEMDQEEELASSPG
jgi:DNA polymerase III alpha subunit